MREIELTNHKDIFGGTFVPYARVGTFETEIFCKCGTCGVDVEGQERDEGIWELVFGCCGNENYSFGADVHQELLDEAEAKK